MHPRNGGDERVAVENWEFRVSHPGQRAPPQRTESTGFREILVMPYSFIRFPLAAASHNSMFFSAGVTYWAPAQGISLVTLMIESTVAWRPMAIPNASGGASPTGRVMRGSNYT